MLRSHEHRDSVHRESSITPCRLVGNETLEAKGKIQKNLGKAQAKYGDIKHDVKDIAKPACT